MTKLEVMKVLKARPDTPPSFILAAAGKQVM